MPESLIKIRTTHQRTVENVDKERLFVEAELANGGLILANATDFARKAKENSVELQEARNPLIPNEFQTLVAVKWRRRQSTKEW